MRKIFVNFAWENLKIHIFQFSFAHFSRHVRGTSLYEVISMILLILQTICESFILILH